MADLIPPKPVRLEQSQFPAELWALALVSGFNQFAVQVVKALSIVATKFKTLSIRTGDDVAASFPILIPVDAWPDEVRVAAVLSGDVGFDAVTVKWDPITNNGSTRSISIRYITGLSANSTYSIKLAYL